MKSEIAGITRANEGMQGISWNILGQTYVPKNVTEHCFSWHATLPPGTFVPPHIHPDQDEYLYMLEGKLDFMLDGAETQATAGRPDTAAAWACRTASSTSRTRPRRCCSGCRRRGSSTTCSGRIHNMKEQKPDDVVAMAAEYNIHFLPPPPGA